MIKTENIESNFLVNQPSKILKTPNFSFIKFGRASSSILYTVDYKQL